MPKRKRDDHDRLPTAQDRSQSGSYSKRQSARGPDEKIHHGKKELHRALKIAKGFERQKLGRRSKAAVQQKDDVQVSRLEAEIQALKTLDLNAAAESHLYKTLLKEKAISTSPLLPSYVTSNSKHPQDTATINVTARLYNSNPVKEALGAVLPPIRAALGVASRAQPTSSSQKSKRNQEPIQNEANAAQLSDEDEDNNEEGGLEDQANVSSSEGDDISIRGRQLPRVSADGESDDEEGFDDLNSQVASGSDEESYSGSDVSLDKLSMRNGPQRLELSISPAPSGSASPDPPAKAKGPRKEARPTASSTFLPSLTMGGYLSGSDSGSEPPSDIDEDAAPRKNRRGQRERRQIWEKKYGKRAKHLQNESGSAKGRDQGWDPKRGAQLAEGGTRKKGYQPHWMQKRDTEKKKPDVASGGNVTKLGKRPSKTGGGGGSTALHPSWEAAKKAKEQRQTGPFEGKKVVFD